MFMYSQSLALGLGRYEMFSTFRLHTIARRAAVLSTFAAASNTNRAPQLAAAPPDARLRRASTSPRRYSAGLPYAIVRVPQNILGIDVGHISLLVGYSSDEMASVGFYAKGYRSGLPMVSPDQGILVSPDPLYTRAAANKTLAARIVELHTGQLDEAQAAALNAWTDDSAGALALTRFTTSAGKERELAISRLDGERYVGLASLLSGADNCATFVERVFEGRIKCTLGIPRWCEPVPSNGRTGG
jgi:hypothetical protein